MKETPKRRITVTSSLNEISKDQLGKQVVVKGVDVNFYSCLLDSSDFSVMVQLTLIL
jgi:hypothetical protein